MANIKRKYIEWLCELVDCREYPVSSYMGLIKELHSLDYYWLDDTPELCMDENRANDGLYLRYVYDKEHKNMQSIEGLYDQACKTCSVLEMLVALGRRIEQNLMGSGENDYAVWFWRMIENLGLAEFDDEHYDKEKIDEICENFMSRMYKKCDTFGVNFCNPFFKTVTKCKKVSQIELWKQAMEWLNDEFCDSL